TARTRSPGIAPATNTTYPLSPTRATPSPPKASDSILSSSWSPRLSRGTASARSPVWPASPSRTEGPSSGLSGMALHEQLQQRLLGMAPVLGLVPDPLASPVQDLRADLLARMSGQVVHRERPGGGGVEQGVVDPVARQGEPPLLRG